MGVKDDLVDIGSGLREQGFLKLDEFKHPATSMEVSHTYTSLVPLTQHTVLSIPLA